MPALVLLAGIACQGAVERSAELAAAPGAGRLPSSGTFSQTGTDAFYIRSDGHSGRVPVSGWITDATLQHRPEAPSPDGLRGVTPPSFWQDRFRPIFVKGARRPEGGRRVFLSLRNGGLLFSDDGGRRWVRVASIPRRFVPPDYGGPVLFRDVEDLWQNPRRPKHLLAVVKHHLLESLDGGRTFSELPPTGVRSNYSAVAGRVDASGELQEIFLGTSVNAIYRIFVRDGRYRRKGYRHSFRGLPFEKHDDKNWIFEEVVGLAYDENRATLLVAVRFGGGLYEGPLPKGRGAFQFTLQRPTGFADGEHTQSIALSGDGEVVLGTERGLFVRSAPLGATKKTAARAGAQTAMPAWKFHSRSAVFGSTPGFAAVFLESGGVHSETARAHRRAQMPTELRALYVSPTTVRKRQRQLFRLLDRYPFNSAVIDVKDDFGRLVYGSKLPEARAMGNDRERVRIRELVTKLKKRNLYLIARMVVFKDNRMFRYRSGRYALLDRSTGRPWVGTEAERWVDTYSTYVQNYNLRVAREVLALGFDEIQFDYIRFPSDGPVHRIRWRHRRGKAYKAEALEAFLRKARLNIEAPLSIDIYGYNGMYRIAGRVGQDLLDLGQYVDVVSPMHYSSHYGPKYLQSVDRRKRTYTLLRMGTERPRLMGAGRFVVRPWVQCFKMMIGRWGWGKTYMRDQIRGVQDGGGQGVLWWGPLRLFHLPGKAHQELLHPASTAGP